MKKHLFAIVAITIAIASCGPVYVVQSTPPPSPPVEETPEVTYQTFYDDLSPYGQWTDYPGYGYVWMPNAGPDFKPYATNGQWVYTNEGWTWSSGYNWGWATFHYGRWFFDANYGWLWVPGYEWAPAWVSWRQSSDYYGWAPLGPNVTVGVAVSNYNPPSNYWCFVPHQYIASPSARNYYVNESRNVTIINNTTVINNSYTVNNNVTNNRMNNTTVNNNTVNNTTINNRFVAGPDPREVSRFTGTTVTPATVRQSNTHTDRFSNGQLEIYRPRVNAAPANNNAANNSQQRVAPSRVVPLSNTRSMFNRGVNPQQPATQNNTAPNNNNQPNRPDNSTQQNNNPANTNNNPNRFNNNSNQNQQPANNNGNSRANDPVVRPNTPNPQPSPPANNNSANTNNNPNRNNNNPNQQPANNSSGRNNNPNRGNNNSNQNQQPANNSNNPNQNANNRSQNNRPANSQVQQNNNPNTNQNSNRDRVNRQIQNANQQNKKADSLRRHRN